MAYANQQLQQAVPQYYQQVPQQTQAYQTYQPATYQPAAAAYQPLSSRVGNLYNLFGFIYSPFFSPKVNLLKPLGTKTTKARVLPGQLPGAGAKFSEGLEQLCLSFEARVSTQADLPGFSF